MKHTVKFAAFVLIISVSVTACDANKKRIATDSVGDSSKVIIDTIKKDTIVKTDAIQKNTVKTDTAIK